MLHYIDDLPQTEVARRMGISTASVSRLLSKAREDGIVQFEVKPLDAAADDESALAEALGLKLVRVLDTAHQPALSVAVRQLIREASLPRRPVMTIGWGRAVQNLVDHGLPTLANAVVVPSTGGMNQTQSHFQINEIVRAAAEQTGGTAHLLYAPAAPGPELYAHLIQDPQIAVIMELWSRIDVSITGIGDFPDTSAEGALGFSPDQAAQVVGDIVRLYFGIDGKAILWPRQESRLGISRAQLQRVPLAIGVATGESKVDAIIGASRSGMINTLVTDIRTAKQLKTRLAPASGDASC